MKTILFVFLSSACIFSQAWFPIEVGNKYQFMKKSWLADVSANEHWEYELYSIEVFSDTIIAEQQYFKTTKYPNTWIRHDCRDSKTYIRWDAKDHIYMDYSLPADSLFTHLDPDSKTAIEVLSLDSTKYFAGEERIMKGYRNFETSPTGFTDLYFTPDIGFFNIYHQHQIEGGGVTTINYDLLNADLSFQNFSDGTKPQFFHNPLAVTLDSLIAFTLTVNHTNNHIFPAGSLDVGINFIDSVQIKSRYRNDELIIENPTVECYNIPNTADWFAEIDLDLYLLQNGYDFEYSFHAVDKALLPVHVNSPDSGYYLFNYTPTLVDENPAYIPSIELFQNYPNPFNPATTISYSLKNRNFVSINVFDVLGNKVEELLNEEQPGGDYKLQFNGSDLPSGVYICKLKTDEFSRSIKLILLK